MSPNNLSVVITVGPNPVYSTFLSDALHSVAQQTLPPGEILIVDDGSSLLGPHSNLPTFIPQLFSEFGNLRFNRYLEYCGKAVFTFENERPEIWVSYWKAPWNIGFAQAFNCGVGLSLYDNILFLAADDMLGPNCISDCLLAYEIANHKDAWYALTYATPNGIPQSIPNNAAMITKNLWRWMRGFPPSAFAGPDALMLSRLMVHAPDRIIKVAPGRVNYHIREHPQQETHHQASFFLAEMDTIRTKETARFSPDTSIALR